jgi:diguanylate cyclase (GGDEF)-like protein
MSESTPPGKAHKPLAAGDRSPREARGPQIQASDLLAVLEATPDFVVISDGERFHYMNKAAMRFLGNTEGRHAYDVRPASVVPGSQNAVVARAIEEVRAGRSWRGELLLERHDGALVPFSAVAFEVGPRAPRQERRYAVIFHDLSTQKAYELELESNVFVEELTGLANRRRFLEQLGRSLREPHDRRHRIGLVAIDLDRFKLVNDSMGPAAGNRLLIAVADRIQLAVRSSDLIARLSGDEFVVMCEETAPDALQIVAERIRQSLSQPFSIARREIALTASIGIVRASSDRTDPEALLQDAITAYQQAKDLGGDRIAFFDPVQRLQVAARLSLEQELRKALRNDEFELVYQKEVWLRSGDLVCFESLIRWHHPQRGLVSPDEFIPIAEATGLIVPIGEWVISRVCRQLNDWAAAGLAGMSVSINVSPRQITQSDFPRRLLAILEQESIRPNQINLEITESVMSDQSRAFLNRIQDLQNAGFTMVMDDFGTGYSSLSQLRTLPFSVLKIDKAFILQMLERPADQQLVDAMIRMAHALGRIVVAEGVETAEHAERLTKMSCEMAQGWYFGKPQSPDEITAWLLSKREKREASGDEPPEGSSPAH